MARQLLPGSKLNEIALSLVRYPGFRVLVWNPRGGLVTIGQVAAGTVIDAPLELTDWATEFQHRENIGLENADDPSVPSISLAFLPKLGSVLFNEGWLDDGVIVRVLVGDLRVHRDDWVPIFTGTFRGRAGVNKGVRADKSQAITAQAYGREERFLNLKVTTDTFPAGTDLGAIAFRIAWKHMKLTQGEILFGALGVPTLHTVNQLVDTPALEAIYQCTFPAGKKPKFDAEGRLTLASFDLDKPSTRVWKNNLVVHSIQAAPNDVEVMNQVVLQGQDHNMTKALQDARLITEFDVTTGFFESELKRRIYYSDDHTQRAQDTYLVTRHKIKWSDANWTERDEFSGTIDIDTHFLRNVRSIIFGTYLAAQLGVAALDYLAQQSNGILGDFLAVLRLALQILSQLALAALLWSMNFIGRGHYEVWGQKYEWVYQQLTADCRLVGLDEDELRKYEYRNDFISTMAALNAAGRERLRRELMKDQLHEIEALDDPLVECDDVVEDQYGSRYYVVSVERAFRRGAPPMMRLRTWQVYRDIYREATGVGEYHPRVPQGYGFGYGEFYGRQL